MRHFLQRFGDKVIGVLHGFDRLRFRGTKRLLMHVGGMLNFLWQMQVPLKDFKDYACDSTRSLRDAVTEAARAADRPLIYLPSSADSKEDLARQLAAHDGIRTGLVCVLSAVEPCWSYSVHPDRQAKRLELRGGPKRCLHYYHYYLDPELGLLHTRLQTWFPFTVQVCLNGREWLARQLDRAGIGYVRRANCFADIEDLAAAQRLMDQQLRTDWPQLLEGLARRGNPAHDRIFSGRPVPYYWSAEETEWASDLMFRSAEELAGLYPRLIRHGLEVLGSADVLRYLGRKVSAERGPHGNFAGEVVTDLRARPEGLRLKHRLNRNWVKMYDKQGTVLRIETVINDAHDLKVYRPKEGDPGGDKDWRYLRKGVADLQRRAEVSQKANERYADSLAQVEGTTPLGELAERLCRPVTWQGQRVRALNPLAAEDASLLEAVSRGEFLLNGFRNRDLRPLLFGAKEVPAEEVRRQSAAVTRKVRLLRAHGLIQKVPKSHRYLVSEKGRAAITALLAARQADTAKLTQVA